MFIIIFDMLKIIYRLIIKFKNPGRQRGKENHFSGELEGDVSPSSSQYRFVLESILKMRFLWE